MLLIRALLKALLLPPGLLIFAGLAGILLLNSRPRIGKALLLFSLLTLYLFSTPALVALQSYDLEAHKVLNADRALLTNAEAIVVLGGGIQTRPTAYGGNVLKAHTLIRVHQGAYWQKQLGLPLLVAGGKGLGKEISEAQLMSQTLKDYYGVETRWLEQQSRTTWENAQYSAEILLPLGIQKIVLVTEANHMDRSAYSFQRAGFDVIPAPTYYFSNHTETWELMDFLPQANAFDLNYKLLHERIGLLVYRAMYDE